MSNQGVMAVAVRPSAGEPINTRTRPAISADGPDTGWTRRAVAARAVQRQRREAGILTLGHELP